MATTVALDERIELLGTGELLHEHLTTILCQTVFQQTRSTERERHWSLKALASFWTEVIVRALPSLTQALREAALGNGVGWPPVQASPEAFFQRCQSLNWRFFAKLHEAFLTQVLPPSQPVYALPVHALREHFNEVWTVDGSRLDAVAKRLKLLWDVRAHVLPGCLTAFYALYRGILHPLAFDPDAAAAELPRATAALGHIPKGTLPPLSFCKPAIPRPPPQKTPAAPPSPILSCLSRRRIRATPCCTPQQHAAAACWESRHRRERTAAAGGGCEETPTPGGRVALRKSRH
jgi:hypothetical protein